MPSTALHCWQLAGRTNVCGIIGAKGSPRILLASPTSALKAFTPHPKLVIILRPIKMEG